jgi:hypothetical protein
MIQDRMTRAGRWGPRLAPVLVAGNLLLLVMTVGIAAVVGMHGGTGNWVMVPVWFAVGSVLVLRRPDNAIGWVLSLGVLCWLLSAPLSGYAQYGYWEADGALPGLRLAFWLATWTWVPGYTLVLPLMLLWFPNGRPPSPRWRPVAWALLLGTGLLMIQYTMISWIDSDEFPALPAGVENPIHSPAIAPLLEVLVIGGAILVIPALLASMASLVVRFRRSRGVERQQLKWVTYAAAVGVGLFMSGNFTTRLPFISWELVSTIAATIFPVAIALAVLRYRLYDIDRVISRTVTYATLTIVLVGVYVGGVVGVGRALQGLTGGAGGDLIVAATTLVVAALFQPARRRIQRLVDRRFNRSRYDAQRTIETFGQRLRDEVDLESLAGDLRSVVEETVRPRSIGLWLPEEAVR